MLSNQLDKMPMTTRSMTTRAMAKAAHAEDCLKEGFKREALMTQGIISNITKFFTSDDDLKSTFMLINDKRYRHEAMYHCASVKEKYELHMIKLEREQQAKREYKLKILVETQVKSEIFKTLGEYLEIHSLTEGEEYLKISVFAIYEYLSDVQDYLHLFGSKFASAVYQNFTALVHDLENDIEATEKVNELRNKLSPFLENGYLAYEEGYFNDHD